MSETSPEASTSTSEGTIVAGIAGSIVSKYVFRWSWQHSVSGIPITLAFNINADVAVPSFRSAGPLAVHYNPLKGQPHGFMGFNGIIGRGKIYITIDDFDIVISGPITGGPEGGQSFVGFGTWTAS